MSKPKFERFVVEGKNLDVAIQEKRAYDFLVKEHEAKVWVEEMLNEKIPGLTVDFVQKCRDGMYLCRLANIFTNNSIKKIHSVKAGTVLEFMAIENLNNFLKACKTVNLPVYNLFGITDIWESKNIVKVVFCIHALANFLEKTFPGKYKKIKDFSKSSLEFDDEEIDKIKNELKKMENSVSMKNFLPMVEKEEDSDDLELASPDECLLEGNGLKNAQAGVSATFTIIARDSIGNVLDHGDEHWKVVLFSKDDKNVQIKGKVVDLKNGRYTVTYVPQKSGEYELEVYLIDVIEGEKDQNLTLLKGCPHNVTVVASKQSDATKCEIEGAGSKFSTAGKETRFTFTSRDAFGNKGLGGENLSVILKNKDESIVAQVKDCNNGEYEVVYTCPKTGNYDFDIKMNGVMVPVVHSLQVKDSGYSKPELCEIVGLESLQFVAGQNLTFQLLARDENGIQRISGGENFSVKLTHIESNVETLITLNDEQNGLYDAKTVLVQAGAYILETSLNGTLIKNGKMDLVVASTGKMDPSKCITNFSTQHHIPAGEKQTISIQACDEYGNPIGRGGENFIVRFTHKTKREIHEDRAYIKDLQDGNYQVLFTLEQVGDYVLEVLTAQNDVVANIAGFPLNDLFVVESGVTDPLKCKIIGHGLEEAMTKQPSEFTIIMFDHYTNHRTCGGDKIKVVFTCKSKNLEILPEVTDCEDGSYAVYYIPDVPADADFDTEIYVNGTSILTSPMKLHVKGLSLKEIDEDHLETVEDYELLHSLISLFKQEDSLNLAGKIQELREKMIGQIRRNFELENGCKAIEKKIELLIDNRIKAEEAAQQVGSWKRKATEKKKVEIINTSFYSAFFYTLQTEPKYLARLLYVMPTEKVDRFLETAVFSLFGYAFSPREEQLILNLFKESLKNEVEREGQRVGSFLEENPILPKLLVTYGRRLQGKLFLQKCFFDKIIAPILKNRDLDLEMNASKVYRTWIADQEISSGEKMNIDLSSITYSSAMQVEHIHKLISTRVEKLVEICKDVIQTLIDNVADMPFGMRWICKQLNLMLIEKHPKSTDGERFGVLGYLIWYRYLNPALVAPDSFELTKTTISGSMRSNLLLIARVVRNLSSSALFDSKMDEHLVELNQFIKSNESLWMEFLAKLINVQDPEETLGISEFSELMQKTTPTITIHLSEIYETHTLVNKYLAKITSDDNDPLCILMENQELPKNDSGEEEIKLPLINPNEIKSTSKATIDQIYEQTKESFRKILRSLPVDCIGNDVAKTLNLAKEYSQKTLAQDRNNEQARIILLYVSQVEGSLPKLVENGKVSRESNYREIIIDITREVKNHKIILERQHKELARLEESYLSLKSHQRFLEEKVADFDEFLKQTMANEFKKKDNKQVMKKHNFTYQQLEKKGVIVDMDVMKSQRTRVKFTISMPEAGLFQVDAKVLNAVVSTITFKLDELLQKKSRGEDRLEFEHVTLDVNMTLHVMNKLFVV